MIKVTKGLDLPIQGKPDARIDGHRPAKRVAVLGEEHKGMKPTMLVEEGDRVRKGQPLFADKKTPGVVHTAPAAGVVEAIHRGDRRVLQSVVIAVEGEQDCTLPLPETLDRASLQQLLLDSGLWTALRTRPFSRVPAPDSQPVALFVNAMDTQPLAADPDLVISEQMDAFRHGLEALTLLTDGKVHLCHDNRGRFKGRLLEQPITGVDSHQFVGPHPAGLVGTHIHALSPVSLSKTVWHIGYQDVIAIGKLVQTGELYTDRVIALTGPQVAQPRLLRTQLGADVHSITDGELKEGNNRIVSGSILSGHNAHGPHGFLGRFHNQVTVLQEGYNHRSFGWIGQGRKRFSLYRSITTLLARPKQFPMTTDSGGINRPIIAYGRFDDLSPLDLEPALLLRDLVARDTDEAQLLGALELDEEDVALFTFACPGKYDYGAELRVCLDLIEKEG
ncbi:Na(+)-translocating NADH-quinone reductase subunit A [Ferrimonas marina]|uniref:Na(+)-translocating NADH-quinone reductase subunit A n=1 Tax=Ferrimonas marina TaxID=299255 RepID=UPI00082BBDD9|nr:Na(+)-translocating NADH-quinone reductase subunit A [Ferrimonas marina]